MRKLKNRWKALIVGWWLMLWWQWVEASAHGDHLWMKWHRDKPKTELLSTLSEEKSKSLKDSLQNILDENYVSERQTWVNGDSIKMYYSQSEYFKKFDKLEKEFREEVKRLKLNKTVFQCWKKEFDQKMDSIKHEVQKNPDKYGYFNSEWKFIINKEEYKSLIMGSFPEFYQLYWEDVDVFMEMWNNQNQKKEKYNWWALLPHECNDDCPDLFNWGFLIIGLIIPIIWRAIYPD